MVQVIITNIILTLILSVISFGYLLLIDEYQSRKYNTKTLFERLGLESHLR